jgi:hypothetical protein
LLKKFAKVPIAVFSHTLSLQIQKWPKVSLVVTLQFLQHSSEQEFHHRKDHHRIPSKPSSAPPTPSTKYGPRVNLSELLLKILCFSLYVVSVLADDVEFDNLVCGVKLGNHSFFDVQNPAGAACKLAVRSSNFLEASQNSINHGCNTSLKRVDIYRVKPS